MKLAHFVNQRVLRRIFLCLFLFLTVVAFFVLRHLIHNSSKSHVLLAKEELDLTSRLQQNGGNVVNGTRILLIDTDCLAKLSAGLHCDYPVQVAVPLGQQLPNNAKQFIIAQFLFEDLPEKNFWLFTGNNNGTTPDKIATKKFKTSPASLRFSGADFLAQLEVPAPAAAFARAWRNGRFLECRPVLSRPKDVYRKIPLDYLDRVVQFADLIDQHNATAFIFSGTLLGWRRECSLIPHTLDIDLALFHDQHSDALLRAILTSPTFVVHWVLGRLRDSFELAVNVDGFKIDLFYVYHNNHEAENNENSTSSAAFVGGMQTEKRQHLRWHYPGLGRQICAGQLHGRLVHLPCEHDKVIEADYGPEEWKTDVPTNAFVWDQAHKNKQSMEVYTEEEWPNVFLLVQNKTECFDQAVVDRWMAHIGKTA